MYVRLEQSHSSPVGLIRNGIILKDVPQWYSAIDLGFKIVPVIHRAFAKRYGLDESACVAYEDSGLAEALGRALELDERQYVNCVEQLALARQRVWDESIANLQARIYA